MTLRIYLISGVSVILTSCSVFTQPASEYELKSGASYWFDHDSTRSSAIFSPGSSAVKYCMAPPPDVSLSLVSSIKAGMTTKQINEINADAKFSTAVIDLARRTEITNFIRDTLYRVCELRLQGDLGERELQIFLAAIRSAENMTKSELRDKKIELVKEARQAGVGPEAILRILKE